MAEFGENLFPMVLRRAKFPHSAKKKDLYESPFEMGLELYLEEFEISTFKMVNTYIISYLLYNLDEQHLEHNVKNSEIIINYMEYLKSDLDKVLDNIAYMICPNIKVSKKDIIKSGNQYLHEMRRINLVYKMYGIDELENVII